MDGRFPLWRIAGRGTDGGLRVRDMRGGVAHRLRTGAPLHEREAGGSAPAGILNINMGCTVFLFRMFFLHTDNTLGYFS